jgi:4-hydroxy-3-methylbut-2-enyl diphosphate reductase
VVVDTTCGSVLNVWKNVERYAKEGFTSLVHGKFSHEETRATVSRVLLTPGGHYLVVFDMAEAEIVADYVRGRGNRAEFLRRFAPAASPGFDPDRDLRRIGVANQTTMLSSESLAIARLIGAAIAERDGAPSALPAPGLGGTPAGFRSFDTICSATQDRQDALAALIGERPDLLVVIGGYNSSNTGHLLEMAAGKMPAFHIEGPGGLLSATRVRHKPASFPAGGPGAPSAHSKTEIESEGWLPAGPLTIGLTAGASTPDVVIGQVVGRILELRGSPLAGQASPGGQARAGATVRE